ncbi:MAG: metal ABC transporter substrate-binding protein [Ilumatobacteraceae bacterium]
MKRLPIIVALAITGVGACANEPATDDGTLRVAVAFYPIEEIVRRVGGSTIEVATLVPPGDEPHEFEPTARQVADLENADVVFYFGSDFQPSLERAIDALPDSVRRVDLLHGLTLITVGDGVDPHVWLDPRNMQAMTQIVTEVLGDEAPEQPSTFGGNAATYVDELGTLHNEFATGLVDCAVPVLITTHEAFGYLAHAYGLTQLAIAGISPGDEPSAKSLEDLAELASQYGVTTVFFEENLPPDLARTVADEIGANVSSLGTAETLTRNQLDAGESYVSIMRANLQALRAGLGCA